MASTVSRDINLADYIDHTQLSPTATTEAIFQLCEEADQYHFPTVCVYPIHVKQAVELLHHKTPRVCTVIGFPTGATTSAIKRYEAQEALENGAAELDVVINLSWLKQGNFDAIHQEMAEICALSSAPVKAILETAILSDAEKRMAAQLCMEAGVKFLKTSTGWQGGVTVEDVRLLASLTQGRIGIKASGGIRTVEQALNLIVAGATRLGTSHGVSLVQMREAEDLHPRRLLSDAG